MGVTASVVGIASGINSLTGGGVTDALGLGGGTTSASGGNTSTAAGAQAAADPFAQYRSNLGALYAGALTSGSGVDPTKLPGYSAYKTGVLDPSLDASKRSAAASGQLYSGNEAIALQKTGQQGYYGFMTDYMNRLAQGSGATNNPATAAALGVQQGNISSAGVMQGIGGIAQGLSSYSNATQQANINYGATGLPQSSFAGSGNASWTDPSTNYWMTSS
jgi:hypothetical protein